MASRTRRRLIFCSLIVALALPAEAILLQAATSDPKTVAIEWVQSLSTDSLRDVSDDIASFPFIYRRAIMGALTPERRSEIWRRAINRYLSAHPDLSADAVAALQRASALASPENLSNPTAAAKAETAAVGAQLRVLLGKEDADELLYRLGPRDGAVRRGATFDLSAIRRGARCVRDRPAPRGHRGGPADLRDLSRHADAERRVRQKTR